MMPTGPARIQTVENAKDVRLLSRAVAASGRSEDEVTNLLLQAGNRLKQLLGTERTDELAVDVDRSGRVRVAGVAGLIRLSHELELEVVPKFLDRSDPTWREDFFAVASLADSGRLLPTERLLAGYGARGDLASLVARAMVGMYWDHHRQPLRTYKTRTVQRFGLDGEVDPVSIVLPEPDGYTQRTLVLDRMNQFSGVIAAAVEALLPEVRDRDVRLQLMRVRHQLQPQRRPTSVSPTRLPARHAGWQSLYDLSLQVLRGFGTNYTPGPLEAPGYVTRTWSAWQSLLGAGLEIGLSGWSVEPQAEFVLGTTSSGEAVSTTPDFACWDPAKAVPLLADAKYKTYADYKTSLRSTDVYEALAFMEASGAHQVVLLYPRPFDAGQPQQSTGTTTHVETITIGGRRVIGLEVECRGLSGAGGLLEFASNLVNGVMPYAP